MQYQVRALTADGVVQRAFDAAGPDAAAELARAQGLINLSVGRGRGAAGRRGAFSLALFTQELLALLGAGLGLIESIQALAERQSAGSAILQRVIEQLRAGRPLSAALADQPALFPALYVETVRAAEQTGALAEALSRYVVYAQQMEDVRQKLVSALIYPALLLGVGVLVALFLLGYVVPRFSSIYLELGREMPWASRMLFSVGAAIDRNPWFAILAAGACVAAATAAVRAEAVRARALRTVLAVPVLGENLRTYRIARLYRTLSMLLRGGVPLVSALRMVSGILDAESRQRLDAARAEVAAGRPLSSALDGHGLTTGIALRMLQVGERSGDLGGLMAQAAHFHEQELARWVERATRLFEPVLMMIIGLMIGGIVVLMYMPIFELAGSLQ
jgi:general secretion pathway protein F